MPDGDKIPFDYLGAKKAGYNDGEIMGFLKDKYAFEFDIVGAKKSGYSDKEVADYITAYEPPSKKKVSSLSLIGKGLSTGAGEAGTSNVDGQKTEDEKIGEALKTVSKTFVPEKEETPIKIDDSDPVGSLNKHLVERILKMGSKGDMQSQKLSFDNQREAQKNIEHKLSTSYTKELMDEVHQNAFPTTQDAQNWLVDHAEKNNGEISPNNETAKLAQKVINDKVESIGLLNKNNGDIPKTAVEFYGSKDNEIGGKIRAMNGNIPRAMQGNLEYEFLKSKPMQEWSNESQENHTAYKERESNLYQNYPELRTQNIVQKIAQGREDYGYNNPFLNLVGVKSSDEMVDNLVARGELTPLDKAYYEKEVRPLLKLHAIPIKTPGIIERGFESTVNAIQDVPKSVYDLTGIHEMITPHSEDVFNEMQQQYEDVSPKFKGVNKFTATVGDLVGVVAPITGEAKLLQGFNIIKDVDKAHQVAMAATFYHGLYEDNKKDMPAGEARLAALLQTLVYSKINKALPSLGRTIAEDIKPSVKSIVTQLAEDKISGSAAAQALTETTLSRAKQLVGTVSKAAKTNFDMANQMGLATVINGGIKDVFSGKNSGDQNLKNAANTWETMLLGGGPLALLGARGVGRDMVGERLDEIAERPDYFENHIKKIAEQDPEFAKKAPEYLENLNHLKAVHQELAGREDLTPKQKQDFQVLSLNQKIIENKIKNSPDKALSGKDEKQLETIEIEKKIVLDPDMGSKKIVQEFYDNDLLGNGSKELLSMRDADGKPTNKFDPSKVGEYVKEVAQRTNNLDSDWKPNKAGDSSKAAREAYPEAIVEIANERWKEEIEKSKPEEKLPSPTNEEPVLENEKIKEQASNTSNVVGKGDEKFAKYGGTPEDKTNNIDTANAILKELGVDASFSGYSDTNGVSVYFEDANGKKYRISDHSVTSKNRMENEVNLYFDEKTMGVGGKEGIKSYAEQNKKAIQSSTPSQEQVIKPEIKNETNQEGVEGTQPLNPEEKITPKADTNKESQTTTAANTEPPTGEPPKVEDGGGGNKVGVSHSKLTELSQKMGLKEPERGEYLSPQWYADRGRKLLDEGANPNEVDNPNNTLHDRISIARAHLEDLVKASDEIAKTNPEGIDSEEYKKASQEVSAYAEKVKGLGTEAHRAMTSLQGERDIDTDSFTAVKKTLEGDSGKPASKEQEKKIKELTETNQKLKKQAAELEAKLIEETNNNIGNGKEKKTFSEKAKKAADVFRKLKTKPFKFKDENGKEYDVAKMGIGWNDLVELGAKAIEKTGEIADGVKEIIDKIKDADWYVKLSNNDKDKLEKQLSDHYKNTIELTPEAKNIKRLEKQLEDLQKGIAKQTSPRRELTDREKKLQDEIFEAKKSLGLIPAKELPKTKEPKEETKEPKNAGLVRSKMDKPLTEQEQIDADEKELTALQEKFVDKKDNKFSIDEAKSIWDYAKKNYLDKGTSYRDMIAQVRNDLGLSWRQVSDAITSTKVKPISDAMWKKSADYRKNQIATKNWIETQNKSLPFKGLRKVSAAFRGVSVFGHGGIFIGTHAGMTLFSPSQWRYVIPAFIRGWKFAYGNRGNYERRVEELKNSPNYVLAQRAGLKNNPDVVNTEEFQKSQEIFKKIGGEAGVKGFNAIKVLRQDLFDYHYNKLSDIEKNDAESVKQIARLVNNATGASNLKFPEWVKEVTFAGEMESARWGKLTRNPARATAIAIKALLTPEKATVAERVFAKVWARRVGEQIGTMAGLLVANAALQNMVNPKNPTNLTNPNKPDYLKFKFGDITLDPTSGMMGTAKFIYGVGKVPFMNKKELRGDTRIQALGKNTAGYTRGKLAPLYSTIADFFAQQDFNKNPLPFSQDKPGTGHHKLTWGEYAWEKAPLPLAHAAQDMYHSALDNGGDKMTVNHILDGIVSGVISGGTGLRVGEYDAEQSNHSPFTEADKKDPTFKYFSTDWGMELPNTSLQSEKVKGKTIAEYPKDVQEKYVNTHKELLKSGLKEIKDWSSVYLNSDGEVSLAPPEDVDYTKKSLDKLSTEEKSEVLKLAQSQATRKAKEKVFNDKTFIEKEMEKVKKSSDPERINYEIHKLKNK